MASVTVRMDDKLKRQMEAVLDDLGMNITTAFTVFAKAVVREDGLPFELKRDPFWCEANQAHLRAVKADVDAGLHLSEHDLIEVGEDA